MTANVLHPSPPDHGQQSISEAAGIISVMSEFVQVFGRRDDYTINALLRPASKKRQGTKSRDYPYVN
jgi:hypothetical protein